MRARTLAAVALAVASIGLTATPAMATSSDDKDLCKNGGYQQQLDQVDGALDAFAPTFSSQGACIAAVNRGVDLTPPIDGVRVGIAPSADGGYFVRVEGVQPDGIALIRLIGADGTIYRPNGGNPAASPNADGVAGRGFLATPELCAAGPLRPAAIVLDADRTPTTYLAIGEPFTDPRCAALAS